MFFQQPSLSALGAITLLVHASTCFAGHNRHPHRPRNNDLAVVDRRQAPGMTEVSTGELNLLHSEMTIFRGWMNAWFDSTATADPGAAVAQLKQEFQAYDSWITAWMDATMGTGAPAPPPVFASVPLPASQHASVGPSSAETTSPVAVVTLSTASFVAPITTAASVPASSPAAPQSSPPYPTTSAAVGPSTSAASGSSAPVASTAPGSPGSGSPGGSFNAQSSSNVAVYYGQSGATGEVSLSQLCSNSNADIVILAFLTQFFSTGNYPTLNFGAACAGNSPQMLAKGASGLLSCPQMAKDIATCQGKGKKVLLSLGGAEAVTAFSSTTQAQQFAVQLWNLFGAGTGEDKALRPFGDVLIDGFDLDNEDHSTAYYSDFVTALRSAMNQDQSRTYYISAAPQCPRPDASIPLDAMQSMDFVFVQFYNNGECNIGQSGFLDSFKAWSSDLAAKGAGPKLYIGAPGCPACAGSGYLDPNALKPVVSSAKSAGVSNFGGIMLWDGPEAIQNKAGGSDYLEVVKSSLA